MQNPGSFGRGRRGPKSLRKRWGNAARLVLVWLCFAAALQSAGPGHAETVSVTGSAGVDGLDGAPGTTGGDGLLGEPATAVATLDAINEALATGGSGGGAGDGGDAPNASTSAGDGGDGGAGGAANATSSVDETESSVSVVSESTAIGGSGGDAGAGGNNADGTSGVGGTGGMGGAANAFISTIATATSPQAGPLQSTAIGVATGGAGGDGEVGGRGGDASGTISATVAGDTSVFSVGSSSIGGRGGNSISDGGRGGDGGDASSDAVASGSIRTGSISTESFGGQGGLGGSNLGFDGAGGQGGDASSTADVSIDGVVSAFGGITIEALSEGGDGGWAWGEGFDAGSGGAASASASVVGASTGTTVRATSRGGNGGLGLRGASAGSGGLATVSSVSGTSTNGARLTIEARAEAGDGGNVSTNSISGPIPAAADGGDASIIDGVAGTTTGFLFLDQVSVGGDGGDGTVDAGDGGNALSALTREVNSSSVRVLSYAAAGDGGDTTRGEAGRGGDADASASIISSSGRVIVDVGAVGGSSGGTSDGSDTTAASAGNAVTDAYAETGGDGNSILIGSTISSGAVGGDARESSALSGGIPAHGGSATSRSVGVATGDSTVRVLDEAIGGRGGRGGYIFGAGQAGDGGDAVSYAEGSNAGSELVFVEAKATGGEAGVLGNEASEGGRAGSAEAIARGVSTGGGEVFVTARQTGGSGAAVGSAPQSSGADTRIEDAVSGSTSGRVTLRQYARGGEGGVGAAGSSATSILNARNEGGGALEAVADATGGDHSGFAEAEIIVSDTSGADIFGTAVARGGDAANVDQAGGTASATGYGSSSAGGNVTVAVEQNGGDGNAGGAGADSVLVDAVSGETTGTLTLMQTARGGLGGQAFNGSATGQSGEAMSEIDATNPGGGALVAVSSAIGGLGARSSGTSPPATGGQATASGRATDLVGSDVELRVLAQGGDANPSSHFGVNSGDGGEAILGRIYASSAGGNVSVEGTAIGGSAVQQQNQAGRGASQMLSQAVDGDTTGLLTLIQNATAGDGGGPATDTIPSGAGNASSYLDRTKSANHLTLSVTALAGGQLRTSQSEALAVGGDADAQVSGGNDSGGVTLLARAVGGDFETFTGVEGTARRGGNANVRATSTTVVDGADIQIGLASSSLYGAEGGTGATNDRFFSPEVRGGRGGEATSESIGIALGDSQVLVYDRAIGGRGARDDDFRIDFHGEGGDGTSYAEARTAGTSDAIAESFARGGAAGQGSRDPGPGPAGGVASATARAEGLGASHAFAMTFGGGSTQSSIGEAISQASAIGGFSAYAGSYASGRADAEAIAVLRGPGPIAETRVTTFESARGIAARASSHAFYDGREQLPGVRRTYADVRVAGPLATAASLSAGVLAEIDLNVTGSERNNELIDNHALVEMVLATPASDPGRELFIDFDTDLDQEASFDSLHLLVLLGGASLIDETFADASSALLFFTTASNLFLGTEESIGDGQIAISMAMASISRDDRFSAQFSLTQVPEPNVALLLLAGLGVLSAMKERSRM